MGKETGARKYIATLSTDQEKVRTREVLFLFARDACERAESKTAELKAEIAKLKGQNLNLSPDELSELLDVVKETIRKISDQQNLLKVKKIMEDENRFCCPLSMGIYTEPVVAQDGHTYDKKAIETWIESQVKANEKHRARRGKWLSPNTKVLLDSKVLVPNFAMKSLMEEEIHQRVVKMRDTEVSR